MTSKLLPLTALAASICLAQPAHAQGSSAADTGAVAGPEGHGSEIAPALVAPETLWFTTAPFYEQPVWAVPPVYTPAWGFPFVYSPPYPGPLNPVDFAVLTPAAVYGNLPLLGINTPLHTAGGEPVRYIRIRAVINLVPGE